MSCIRLPLAAVFLLVSTQVALGQEAETSRTTGAASELVGNDVLLEFVGKWEGNCKTWFRPGKLADESPVTGEFTPVMNGKFVRHRYEGSMMGKPRQGEELLAFNSITKTFQSSWVDDFHMNDGILFSQGTAQESGFDVDAKYDVPQGPPWGWRTEYRQIDANHLTITAYNIQPNGNEGKAVEVTYERVP